jgi:hypothetical protein
MDPEIFAKCIVAHRIKSEVYNECANQLEAALSKSGAPAVQTGNSTKVEITPTCGDCNCSGADCSTCVDESNFKEFIEPA